MITHTHTHITGSWQAHTCTHTHTHTQYRQLAGTYLHTPGPKGIHTLAHTGISLPYLHNLLDGSYKQATLIALAVLYTIFKPYYAFQVCPIFPLSVAIQWRHFRIALPTPSLNLPAKQGCLLQTLPASPESYADSL